jgi:hypothetical protein
MNVLGGTSKTTFLAIEPNKISQEFTADAALKVGQPVKLNTDGEVIPWAKADGLYQLIGYCYSQAAQGDLVTVFTRGWMVQYAMSNAALPGGPATWEAYDAATAIEGNTGYNKYGPAAGVADACAWNLTPAGAAGVLIRILCMD